MPEGSPTPRGKREVPQEERQRRAQEGFGPRKTRGKTPMMIIIHRRMPGVEKTPFPQVRREAPDLPEDSFLAVVASSMGEALARLAEQGEDLRKLNLAVPPKERNQAQAWRSLAGFVPSRLDLSGCDLSGNALEACPNWFRTNARDTIMHEVTARSVDFTGARFDGSYWRKVKAEASIQDGTSYVGAKVINCSFDETVWRRPFQTKVAHDLAMAAAMPAALPDGDPFAHSEFLGCTWKGAEFSPEMGRARRIRRSSFLGESAKESLTTVVMSPPALVLAGAAANRWGASVVQDGLAAFTSVKDMIEDPMGLATSVLPMLPDGVAGTVLAVGFAIGATAGAAMLLKAARDKAADFWSDTVSPRLSDAYASVRSKLRGTMYDGVAERLNYLLVSRSKRVLREIGAAMEEARTRLPHAFCPESGATWNLKGGGIMLCEKAHLDAAQYELAERAAGRKRGAKPGPVLLLRSENRGTSAPTAIAFNSDGCALVATASSSGKRVRLVTYDVSGMPVGVYDTEGGRASTAAEMEAQGIQVPTLKEVVERMQVSLERVAATTPTSERAPSLLGDSRLDLEYDPDTHFATCGAGRVVIRSRKTGRIDNPLDYAVAMIDPETRGATFITVNDGVAGPRQKAKAHESKPRSRAAKRPVDFGTALDEIAGVQPEPVPVGVRM